MATNTSVDILLRVRDEASAKMRELANETGGLVGTFQRLTAGIGLWGGIATGVVTAGAAMVAASKHTSDLVEQLDRATAISGVGSESLQAMFKIVEDGGGSTESLVKALAKFRIEIANNNPLLKKLELTQGSVEDRFLKFAEILATTSNEEAAMAAAQELLGKSSMDLIPHMGDLATETRNTESAMRKSGELIGDQVAPRFRDFDEATKGLKSTWKGAWQDIVNAFTGPSIFIINRLTDMLKVIRGFGQAIYEGLLGPLRDLAGAAGNGAPRYQIRIINVEGVEVVAKRNPLDGGLGTNTKQTKSRESMEAENAREAFRQQRQREEAAAQAEFWKRHFLSPLDGGILRTPGGPGGIAGRQPKQENVFKKVIDDWKTAVNEMLAGTQMLQSGLQSTWDGIGSGFQQVALGLTSKFQTIGSAWGIVGRAMRDSFLQYMAEVTRSALFRIFLRLIGNAIIPGGGTAASAATGFVDDTPFGKLTTGAPGGSTASMARAAAGAGSVVNNYYIPSFSQKDVLTALISPQGELRSANSRVYEMQAAG